MDLGEKTDTFLPDQWKKRKKKKRDKDTCTEERNELIELNTAMSKLAPQHCQSKTRGKKKTEQTDQQFDPIYWNEVVAKVQWQKRKLVSLDWVSPLWMTQQQH